MSYMGLFWETGMPEAWALSRKSGDKPEAGMAAQSWPRASVDLGTLLDPANMAPGDGAARPAPTPVPAPDDGEKKD